jgi:ribonuclease HI
LQEGLSFFFHIPYFFDNIVVMLIYYTDGSCIPNPGVGGWAVVTHDGPVALGTEEMAEPTATTNIRMEGHALIHALRQADGKQVQIYSDSEFWINVVTKWSKGWEAKGWVKKGGEIKNLDIVKELCQLYKESDAELIWVRGHNNDPGNEMADLWANKARTGARV